MAAIFDFHCMVMSDEGSYCYCYYYYHYYHYYYYYYCCCYCCCCCCCCCYYYHFYHFYFYFYFYYHYYHYIYCHYYYYCFYCCCRCYWNWSVSNCKCVSDFIVETRFQPLYSPLFYWLYAVQYTETLPLSYYDIYNQSQLYIWPFDPSWLDRETLGMVDRCEEYSVLSSRFLEVADTSWWRHQMETISALLAICAGNLPVPGEFSAQRPVTPELWCFLWSASE